MPGFVESLKRGRTWVVLSLALILVPIFCLLYLAWLTDFQWWNANEWHMRGGSEKKDNRRLDDDYLENLNYQLANVRCPAREGLELRDYWDCLWRTSITEEGLEQDKRIRWKYYLDGLDFDRWVMEDWHNKTLKNATPGVAKKLRRRKRSSTFHGGHESSVIKDPVTRRKRQADSDSSISAEEILIHERMQSILRDNYAAFDPFFRSQFKSCQQQIDPALSIQHFLVCVRKIPLEDFTLPHGPGAYGNSFNPSFRPTTFPKMDSSSYDELEYPLLKMTNRANETYPFIVDFQPLEDEEGLDNFFGADPYFNEHWSPYRYRYNKLTERQRQPGWSYRGLYGSKDWHKLDLKKFFLPLKDSTDLNKITLQTEFAQSYPGVGEIAESLKNLENPMAIRWTKDSGENIYTRYLLPLLDFSDLAYYRSKGLIDSSFKVKSDAEQIQNIIDGMDLYKNLSSDWFAQWDENGALIHNEAKYPKWEDAPFADAYHRIITQFYGIDTARYLQAKTKIEGITGYNLYGELEVVRLLIRAYVDAVRAQEACLKEMVSVSGIDRAGNNDDFSKVKEKALSSKECKTAYNLSEAVKVDYAVADDTEYKVTLDSLKTLYDRYYNMKEARDMYSLPQFPIEFPICKHNEPSPINIETDATRQSTMKDYSFGDAGYQLSRFFMFFPMDGSPLLTLGIVDAERVDGSAVPLKGGAVRGQYLTFQYMHIRFASEWKGVGSEHQINGKGAPMELQMIFTTSGSADSLKYWHILARVHNRLFQYRDKLVIILSVLVDVLESDEAVVKKIEDEDLKQDPYLFEPLAQAAYHFRKIPLKYPTYEQPRGYVSKDPVFRFVDFIPAKPNYFYTYRGSLTWPPCFGYVIWSVFEQRLYMSKRQFDQFAKIPAFGVEGNNFAHNNIRNFEDIYVEEENDHRLTNAQIRELKRVRTKDRHILVGWHDPTVAEKNTKYDSNNGKSFEGVVGDEVYYMEMALNNGSSRRVSLGLAEMCIMIGVFLLNVILV